MKLRNHFMRFFKFALALLVVVYAVSSCTVLQWRASDVEIHEKFDGLEIPTRISYFQVDSLDLAVRVQQVERSDATSNVVFFHGSPSSLSAWDGYLTDSLLRTRSNLYAVDRPGYGYSNFGEEMPSIKQQTAVMSALIDDYDLEDVIVVGSSYGGPLAAHIASANPRIKGVIMVSPAIDPLLEKKIWGSRLTQWWITRWLVPTSYRVAGDEKTVHAAELQLIESDWESVNVPVLHIHGDMDDLVPYDNVHYTADKFESIRIITTPDTGHEIAWSRPELIIPHLVLLIEEITAP